MFIFPTILPKPQLFRDAASELAMLKNCPKSALTQLAALATNEAAFGEPSKWNSIQVTYRIFITLLYSNEFILYMNSLL